MSLADHINNNDLRNHELNALAKVRFIDEETQLALAKQPYRRAKMHLASNENLCEAAREELWDHRGYALKCDLVAAGHYVDDPQRYYDLFRSHSWRRSDWRLLRTLLIHRVGITIKAQSQPRQTCSRKSITTLLTPSRMIGGIAGSGR